MNAKAWKIYYDMVNLSEKILNATWEMKSEKVAQLIEKYHNSFINKVYCSSKCKLCNLIKQIYFVSVLYYTIHYEIFI